METIDYIVGTLQLNMTYVLAILLGNMILFNIFKVVIKNNVYIKNIKILPEPDNNLKPVIVMFHGYIIGVIFFKDITALDFFVHTSVSAFTYDFLVKRLKKLMT